MKYFIAILFSCLVGTVSAQYNPDKINKKAVQLLEEAAQKVSLDGDYATGIRLLQQAVNTDPKYLLAYLSIAGIYAEQKKYDSAIKYYEVGYAIDSNYFKDYNLPYAVSLAGKGQFGKAVRALESFLTIPNLNESSIKTANYRMKCFQFALTYPKKNNIDTSYRFQPTNLGDSVNSSVSEYFPTLTIDGNKLVYTRRVRGMNEDFFETNQQNGAWSAAKPLPGDINTGNNEGAQTISQDGQWLIFTGCNFREGMGSCDLYISYLTPEGWSAPENLGRRINTEAWESTPSLSPDKRDLYFSSSRPGGYGKSDIYVSHLQSDGRWGEPVNLGPQINTGGDESSPFIHADNQTLYFTSNGLLGYGESDLFLVRKENGQQWGAAKNLGYPINTIENESTLMITANGKTAYYASDRSDTRGGLDLYTFEMRSDVQPVKTLWIKGKVFDKKTGQGLPSAVELTNLSTREISSKVQTDEKGNYLITLPVGRDYAFYVNRKGYLFFSENFSLQQKSPDSTYHIDIPLQPLEANAAVILKNIFFDVNKYEIKPSSQVELDKVVQLLKDNPTIKIKISGHTDNVGKPKDNLTLSNNRAKAVIAYIGARGILPARLSYEGFGATRPLADNKTEEGKARNRRTELIIIGR
jgi:outer membrane protein OmpA-like peptidoglycan-associated protein/Tol biopolymer transport system component